ncbi:hypothetical protein [Seinonella peptonophila]|nr:hypothetical protein [Seinonella peptonophila]
MKKFNLLQKNILLTGGDLTIEIPLLLKAFIPLADTILRILTSSYT